MAGEVAPRIQTARQVKIECSNPLGFLDDLHILRSANDASEAFNAKQRIVHGENCDPAIRADGEDRLIA